MSRFSLFLSSVGLYLTTFFGIKIFAAGVKILMCKLFLAEYVFRPFWIKPISAADSGVWDFDSVYSIYSVDIFVPFLIFFIAWQRFSHCREVHPPAILLWVWVMLVSSTTFLTAFIAGPVTRSNVFHLLQWLYMPNHLIMAISLLAFPLLVLVVWKLSPLMVKLAPDTSWLQTDVGQRRLVLYGSILPVFAGIIAIVLAAGEELDNYLLTELGGQGLAAMVLRVSFRPQSYRPIDGAPYLPVRNYLLHALILSIIMTILLWRL